MYITTTEGYSHDATQQVTGVLDYVVTNDIGNDISTGSITGVLDYVILDRMGYYTDVNNISSNITDYLPSDDWGNQRGVIQNTTGVIDYFLDSYISDLIIEQERGWGFNWELITLEWQTINDNWNNG